MQGTRLPSPQVVGTGACSTCMSGLRDAVGLLANELLQGRRIQLIPIDLRREFTEWLSLIGNGQCSTFAGVLAAKCKAFTCVFVIAVQEIVSHWGSWTSRSGSDSIAPDFPPWLEFPREREMQ